MKRCTRCNKLKDESQFGKQPRRKDGLRCWCKQCECQYMHDYYRRNRKSVKRYRRYEEIHRVVNGVKQKQCQKCNQWKAETEFHKRRESRDRLQGECKKCAHAATRRYRQQRAARNQGPARK